MLEELVLSLIELQLEQLSQRGSFMDRSRDFPFVSRDIEV